MIKSNYFQDNADLQLHFELLQKHADFVDEYENNFADHKRYEKTQDERFAYAPGSHAEAFDYYREILNSIGELSGHEFAQAAKELDQMGLKIENGKVTFPPKMLENYQKFVDAGLLPYSLKREFGGLGLPFLINAMAIEIMARADIGFSMAIGVANLAEVIERFGNEEQRAQWLPLMSTGEYTGAMALSEPNYGSDLSSVRTTAVKQEDGTYRLNGTKRFITHGCGMGDKPAAILTLARTGSPESGARGLSFFIVDSRDIEVIGIEHKLGLKCSPTCEIAFENSPGTLIGEEGRGLTKFAMGMMNGARLGVANLSVGNATAAYYEAVKYAGEREQFGKKIKDIPAVKKILDRMEREVAAMRCLHLEAAYSIDMYHWRGERMLEEGKPEREVRKDEHIQYWEKLATLFTPLAKYYSSELANRTAYDGVQIFGGSGFCEDYDVARIYRDARILSIYEGTTQLQVVAAIGGIVAGMAPSGMLRQYLENLEKQLKVPQALKDLREIFESTINDYKNISDSEEKSYVAFELVETAARYINGLLLERVASRLTGADQEKRQLMNRAYHVDSLGLAQANALKISEALKSGSARLQAVS